MNDRIHFGQACPHGYDMEHPRAKGASAAMKTPLSQRSVSGYERFPKMNLTHTHYG